MFIKALEINGFKSFPDRTRVEFNDGITVVVGPNGCGKSNIIDALKWVLGEKSAKSLRGEHMEDVIFTGSDTKKPSGMAAVTLHIDNTQNILPGKYTEVAITRKLFRNGTSEYYMNKQPVLLRELHEMFLDTGMGKNAYAFIEQGKVHLLLSKKMEDRRSIFEEAAGISRYKIKKTETLLKLEKTRDNLTRLNDVLSELTKFRNNAKSQAEKAEKYRKLDKEITQNEILILTDEYRQLQTREQTHNNRITEEKKKSEKLDQEIESIQVRIKESTHKLSEARDSKVISEKEYLSVEHSITSLGQQIELLRAQINSSVHSSGEDRIQIKSQEEKKARIQQNIDRLHKAQEEKDQTIKKAQKEHKTVDADLKATNANLNETSEQIDSSKKMISQLTLSIEDGRKKHKEVIDRFVKQIDSKKEEILSQQNEKTRLHESIKNLLEDLSSSLAEILTRLENGRFNKEEYKKEITSILETTGRLKRENNRFLSLHDGFQDLIFDKKGIHAEKEQLEARILSMEKDQVGEQNKISLLEENRVNLQNKKNSLLGKLSEHNNNLTRLKLQKDGMLKEKDNLLAQTREYDHNIELYRQAIAKKEKEAEQTRQTIKELEKQLNGHRQKISQMDRTIKGFGSNIQDITRIIERSEQKLMDKRKTREERNRKLTDISLKQREYQVKMDDIRETLFENYSEKIEESLSRLSESLNLKNLETRTRKLKQEKTSMGSVNHLAIEEFRESDERYRFLTKQKQDIEKAEQDLKEVLNRINSESERMFTTAFKTIRDHYREICRKLFRGGKADLVMSDPQSPLTSPIQIIVQPPGKRTKLDQLSGGEKALSAIALIFSIFITRPSPFCVLDEVDAPLDDQNVMRFVTLMREFAKKTQFLMVTHNKQSMAAADRIYGVTMEEPSISKIVSLILNDVDQEKYQIKEKAVE